MAKPHSMRDYQLRHRPATSAAMKRHAEAMQCPACERKSALKRTVFYEVVIYVCRWCGHEKSYPRKLNK